jgi:uncharacterized protein
MSSDWCSVVSECIRLNIQVMPNARRSEVVGVFDGHLKIRLQAQPIEGKANDALIRYLADALHVPKSAIKITHGHTGKRKIVEIDASHLDGEGVRTALLPAGA